MLGSHKFVAIPFAIVLLIVLAAMSAFWAFRQIEVSADARRNTYIVIDHVEDILSALQDAEIGERGYVITGEDTFLEPYFGVRKIVAIHQEELGRLGLFSASQNHINALAPLVEAKLAELSRVIEIRRKHGITAAVEIVSASHGKHLMDSIRAEIASFMQIEHDTLAQDEAKSKSDMRFLFAVIVVASMLMLLLSFTFIYFVYRESQHRLNDSIHADTKRLLTFQTQANCDLLASEQTLRLFAESVPVMVMSLDEHLHCRFSNIAFAKFLGLTAADILGKHVRDVVGEEEYREFEGHYDQVKQGHTVAYCKTHKLQNGEPVYLEIKLLPDLGQQGVFLGCFVVFNDITEHKLSEQRIQHIAHHDELTGLPNRVLFNDRLKQAMHLARRSGRQFALLYLDLDKFKPVNDTLGHTVGDELLQAVATRIRQQVRESDTVARVGGDEFTVILPDFTGPKEAEIVARKIIAAMAEPFQLGTQEQCVNIGACVGIAVFPTDAQDTEALIKVADAAMYRAKQTGSSFHACEA